ncbi:MAG: hypothetical protein IJR85_07755 [Synergistaceae bacterium]|nr:hypothetical protein [Synergistaceae bacterium]
MNSRLFEYYHDDIALTHEGTVTDSNFTKFVMVYDLGTEDSIASLKAARDNADSAKSVAMVFSVGVGNGYAVENLFKVVPLTKGHYFAIVMADTSLSQSNDDSFRYVIPAEAQIPNRRTAYAQVNANETYFKVNSDDWQDAKNYTFLAGDMEVTGFNACLNAFSYVPDERAADDWTLISRDRKAQLSISLLRETAPQRINVKGRGLSNIMYRVEAEENADTGGASGKFYTLKLICDVEDFSNAAITSLAIDGKETITGYVDVPASQMPTADRPDWTLTEWQYSDITKTGVEFKYMTAATGTIESSEGYTANNGTVQVNKPSPNNDNTPSENTGGGSGGSGGGGGGGCDAGISALGLGLMLAVMRITRRAR